MSEYFTMAQALETEHGIKAPSEQADFVHHLPMVLQHWQADKIEGAPERFAAFEARISDVLRMAGTGPALVVTSGGLIAMTMRVHLRLDIHDHGPHRAGDLQRLPAPPLSDWRPRNRHLVPGNLERDPTS